MRTRRCLGVALVISVVLVGCAPAGPPNAPASATGGAAQAPPTQGVAATLAAPPNAAPSTRAPLNPVVKIPFGDNQTLAVADIYIALDRGYYRDEGLDVQLTATDVPTILQGLATSQFAFAAMNPDPGLFNAMDRGVDVKLLAALTRNKPGDKVAAFSVRKDIVDSGRYKTPQDLKGATIAIGSNQAQFYVDRFLTQNGLALSDIKLVNILGPDIPSAFASKSIDAAWNAEPSSSVAESKGLSKIVAVTGDVFPGAVGVALAVSPGFLSSQPEAAQRFVDATLRGHVDYYHAFMAKDAEKGPIVQILTAHTPIKDPALYDTIGLASVELNPHMDTTSWEVLQEYWVKIGLEQNKVELSGHVDNSYADRAVQRLGLQ
jgi:NitT/TauT family transport system substrate-binding protein